MAVLPRQELVSESITAHSSRNGSKSQITKLYISVPIVTAVIAISGVLLWLCCRRRKRRRTGAYTAETNVVDGFRVLRVKKFVPDDESDAGPWRVIFSESESHSSSSVATTHTQDTEIKDDALDFSRFSDKEVVPTATFGSPASAETVRETSSQQSDTTQTSLINRIKNIWTASPRSPSSDIESIHEGSPCSLATLVESSSTVKGDDCTSRKKEHDVSEEILGTDKRSMLQRLTDPYGEILRSVP
jgi:hypothetical protein